MAKLQPSKSWLSHYLNCFTLQWQKEALGETNELPHLMCSQKPGG